MLWLSYVVLTREQSSVTLLSPQTVALLLVAILVPAMALMVLIARRLARARAVQSEIGGRGRLHTRLVALFSMIAAVPTVLVVIFASLLFQSGMQFWFSDDARTVLRNAASVARVYREENLVRIRLDVEAMGADIVRAINDFGIDSQAFDDELLIQTKAIRNLTEAAVITVNPAGALQTPALVDLDARPLERRMSASALTKLRAGETLVARTPETAWRLLSGSTPKPKSISTSRGGPTPPCWLRSNNRARRRATTRRFWTVRARCSSDSTPCCCWCPC
jgi:two-component system nitrogen regulation sensor histidine kinase NtrY